MFCPGPGIGLFHIKCMPFRLTSSFQRLMNELFRELQFVTVYTYIDNILIHLANKERHSKHLRQIFDLHSEANLTLQGM